MDYIKLAQRTIAMLSSMIESGEYHTTRSKEMKDNALNGLDELRQHFVVGQSGQYFCSKEQIGQRCNEQCLGCFQFENKD